MFKMDKSSLNQLTKVEDENKNIAKFDFAKDGNLVTDDSTKCIVDNVKFKSEPFPQIIKPKKRKQQDEGMVENKRLEEEEYNRELHEQRYKRLMHLLNRSKFYSSYIVDKINKASEKDSSNVPKRGRPRLKTNDENTPPQTNKKKRVDCMRTYDIREYISKDVHKKLNDKSDKHNLSVDEIENELLQDSDTQMEKIVSSEVEVPKQFNGDLRDYQKEGFQWLKVLYENGINGILADEMGLGKTIQVIALFCHLIEKQQDGPYLIVAPLSTIPNWLLEFERFAPHLPVVLLHGPPQERRIAHREIKKKHHITGSYKTQPIVLSTYEMPLVDSHFVRTQNWRYIVVDEGQRIKNHNCLLIKILKMCKFMNRLLLTGTPLQNNLAELWSLLNFLLPEIFDDLAIFESWFDAKQLQNDEGTKQFLQQEEEKRVLLSLREILQPFMLRREKAEVCLEIPPKKEVIVYAPLTKLQHDLYTAVLNYDLQTLSKIDEPELIISCEDGKRPKRRCALKHYQNNGRNIFEGNGLPDHNESDESMESDNFKQANTPDHENLVMWKQYTNVTERNRDFFIHIKFGRRVPMYSKIVNHPYLVHCPLNAVGLPKIDEDLIKSSGKLLVLDAMFAKLYQQGHRILLFSTMTSILDVIEDYLSLRDYRYLRLDGQTPLEDRKEAIKSFNTDSEIFLFLISTRAGGVGLNLAAADTVIIYDSDWNPQMDIQAMARCHRIGQKKPVVVYRLCTKGTIDEAIINRAEAKRVLEKIVISKETGGINLQSKSTLLELKKLIEAKDCEIAVSQKDVFTEAELAKLLDRSDLMNNVSKND